MVVECLGWCSQLHNDFLVFVLPHISAHMLVQASVALHDVPYFQAVGRAGGISDSDAQRRYYVATLRMNAVPIRAVRVAWHQDGISAPIALIWLGV